MWLLLCTSEVTFHTHFLSESSETESDLLHVICKQWLHSYQIRGQRDGAFIKQRRQEWKLEDLGSPSSSLSLIKQTMRIRVHLNASFSHQTVKGHQSSVTTQTRSTATLLYLILSSIWFENWIPIVLINL